MHRIAAKDDTGSAVDMRLQELEEEMPHLYLRQGGLFALASAWAERYDAILALAPAERRRSVQVRLARIGFQWGVMPEADAPRGFRIGDAERRTAARRSAVFTNF